MRGFIGPGSSKKPPTGLEQDQWYWKTVKMISWYSRYLVTAAYYYTFNTLPGPIFRRFHIKRVEKYLILWCCTFMPWKKNILDSLLDFWKMVEFFFFPFLILNRTFALGCFRYHEKKKNQLNYPFVFTIRCLLWTQQTLKVWTSWRWLKLSKFTRPLSGEVYMTCISVWNTSEKRSF